MGKKKKIHEVMTKYGHAPSPERSSEKRPSTHAVRVGSRWSESGQNDVADPDGHKIDVPGCIGRNALLSGGVRPGKIVPAARRVGQTRNQSFKMLDRTEQDQ